MAKQTEQHLIKISRSNAPKLISRVKRLANKLENDYRYTITRKWWSAYIKDDLFDITDLEFYSNPAVKLICEADFKAIRDCDLFILLSSGKPQTGSYVEFGYACALNKPVAIIGEIKRSAMWSKATFYNNIPQFLKVLDTVMVGINLKATIENNEVN